MKHIKSCFLSFCLVLTTFSAFAQDWVNVGNPDFSTTGTTYSSICIDSKGTPYVAYIDDSVSFGQMSVMKFNGSNWVYVGIPRFSVTSAMYAYLALDTGGTPYVAFGDGAFNNKATVMKFDGTSWVYIGSRGFSDGWAENIQIAIDNSGTPYVVYMDGNSGKATVLKYDGSSWVFVGPDGFSSNEGGYPAIAINNSGTSYVVYEDIAVSSVGTGPVTVMKYNGSAWEYVGSPAFSDGIVDNPRIAIDSSGTPYVIYGDEPNSGKAIVKKFDGTNWVNVGSPDFSSGVAGFTTMAIAGGTIYAAYTDQANANKITVMKYNGSSWADAGSPGFSPAQAIYVNIAIDTDNTPYVVYQDGSGGPAKVEKLDTAIHTGIKNIDNPSLALTIFPNPTHNTFTLHLTTQINEPATITITNILGEKVKQLTTTTNTDIQIQLNTPPGVYFILATTKKETITSKIVIE